MFHKLKKECLRFDAIGVKMLGNPQSGYLVGLTEEGDNLVKKLSQGCEITVNELTKDELELFQVMSQQGFLDGTTYIDAPKSAYLHVTNRCNMNCIGCYSGAFRNNQVRDVLQLGDIKKIVDNLAKAKVSSLIISGGEPFVRSDICEILQYLKQTEQFRSVTCITNGTASYESYCRGACFVDHLAFSMDGYSKETSFLRGAVFDKTVDTIQKLKIGGYNPTIIFTLHHRNCRHIREMTSLAKSLSVHHNFSLFTVRSSLETVDLELNAEDINFLIQNGDVSISDTPTEGGFGCRVCCGAGQTLISVCANGDIMPCHMFTDHRFCMGNALKDDIALILEGNNNPLVHVNQKVECAGCEFKYICGGGCPARAYLQNDKLESIDSMCELHKETISSTLRMLSGNM